MSKYNELVKKLKEVFQIDRPELDFGIYRIINARADEINEYLDKRLKQKVAHALASGNAANIDHLKEDLKKAEEGAQALGVSPDAVPKVQELKQKIAGAISGSVEHENAVFSHLLTFFSRYYDNGDFISQRRYKGDTYAIPYAGEEVMLHWANKDQYYIKSGENFSNYSFKLDDGRVVHFRLVCADTAKDNRKDNDKDRRFVLAEHKTLIRVDDEGDEFEESILPVEEVVTTDSQGNECKELVIRFEYKAVAKGTKQDKLIDTAVAAVLATPEVATRWLDLSKREPTEKNPKRTLLGKHLANYSAKNTADYFIHKNLGHFLRGELDFYIKNEVMHLDDVQNAEVFSDIEKSLRMIQCLRSIALDLITFLAQLEDFQKKLWTKKKFVVSSHYCITLDLISEDLYPFVVVNQKQWDRWRELGLWSNDKNGNLDDLKNNQSLLVDTKLFTDDFKHKVIALVDDELVNGILINSDNYQAINLIKCRFDKAVKSIYIDPPYNTDSSEIAYKNGYRSSSWVSLINSRIELSTSLLKDDGILCATIDDEQQKELSFILDENFGKPNHLGTVPIRINPSGRITLKGFAQCHEYGIFYGKSQESSIGKLPRNDLQQARFNQSDDVGFFEWRNFRREGSASERFSRPKRYFPLFINGASFRVPKLKWNNEINGYEVLEQPNDNELVMYPIDSKGTERVWRWGIERIEKESAEIVPRINQRDDLQVYYKYRPNDDGVLPQTIWSDKKFSATEYGTAMLKNIFGGRNEFTFPKSLYAVEDSVRIMMGSEKSGIVLDYFAGSGTTAHATIQLNRMDSGNRKYILVEQGQYFDTVTKPRVEKIVYSAEWKNGKPIKTGTGISHCFKVIKLESYEDALNNLELKRPKTDLFDNNPELQDDYILNYMLDVESRGSVLSTEDFKKPFNYTMKIAVDSAGAFEEQNVDLVETFNYLIGLTVKHIDAKPERGYVAVTGTLPTGETTLVLWRDCELFDYDGLSKLCDKLAINPADNEFDVVYINGDHNIPTVLTQTAEEGGANKVLKLRQIEPEFLARMFAEDDL